MKNLVGYLITGRMRKLVDLAYFFSLYNAERNSMMWYRRIKKRWRKKLRKITKSVSHGALSTSFARKRQSDNSKMHLMLTVT